jgi:hypothetical protein
METTCRWEQLAKRRRRMGDHRLALVMLLLFVKRLRQAQLEV